MAGWTLSDALSLLRQQYPSAYVTSGARDPNSALGRANPRSYHNVGEAFDIRPMQGVNFNDYVSRLKSAGLPVVEALDEQKNPKSWTTGPNWHIAFSGNKQVATSPIDMLRRAQAFSLDIPPDVGGQTPPSFNVTSALANMSSLPDGSGIADALSANKIKADERAAKGSKWAAVLGAISDGLLALGGQQPIYAPLALKQRELDSENNLSRDRLQAQIEQAQARLEASLNRPPTQTDRYVQEVLDPTTPPARRALLRAILTHPIGVPMYSPDGSQSIQYYSPDQMSGDDSDQWEYSN